MLCSSVYVTRISSLLQSKGPNGPKRLLVRHHDQTQRVETPVGLAQAFQHLLTIALQRLDLIFTDVRVDRFQRLKTRQLGAQLLIRFGARRSSNILPNASP